MTTSPTTTNNNGESNGRISRGEMSYVAARNQHTAHNVLLRAVKGSGKSQKELARLTGVDEATISRILRRPSNFQINTYSKLLYAACGAFISISPAYPQAAKPQLVQAIRVEQAHKSAGRTYTYRVEQATEPPVKFSFNTSDSGEITSTKTSELRVLEKTDA